MDRLGFFKQGLSSVLDAANSIIGLKKAVNSFTEAVDEALSNIKTDIGLHLPSLDAAMYEDAQGTLQQVAQIGYSTLELGSYYNGKVHDLCPEELKRLATEAGLKITSAHLNCPIQLPLPEQAEATDDKAIGGKITEAVEGEVAEAKTAEVEVIEAEGVKTQESEASEAIDTENEADTSLKENPIIEWWKRALEVHRELGCKYIVASRLPDYPTEQVVEEYANLFNQIAEMVTEQGMIFCYHPREAELKQNEGKAIFDFIAEKTDPEKVMFEIDTYEAVEAKRDVNLILEQYKQRVTLLQLRDYGIIGESERIDFEKILSEGIKSGVKDIFVEVRSFSLPPINCVERSYYNVEDLPSIRY